MNRHLKEKVIYCLENYPETRNSDIALTISLWLTYYRDLITCYEGKVMIELNNLYKVPNQDDISRWRQKIQNEQHLFLPTSLEVVRKRRINEEIWRTQLGYLNPSMG